MDLSNRTSRVLGAAFLLQFITSFSSGVFLQAAWLVPGNIHETLIHIANDPGLMRVNILVDMLTALGVIFLGAILYLTLRDQNEKMALVGMGFYLLEAALLGASRAQAFALIGISQEYVAAGYPASLQMFGNLALETMGFVGSTLHMLAFCGGGILFYFLLFRSGVVPRALSLWGLITVLPCLVGTLMGIFGYKAPFLIYLPYVPFELVIGMWILIKGIPDRPVTTSRMQVSLEATAGF